MGVMSVRAYILAVYWLITLGMIGQDVCMSPSLSRAAGEVRAVTINRRLLLLLPLVPELHT